MNDQPSGPPAAPTEAQARTLREFDALVAESGAVGRSSAKAWASGVAVFIGLFSSVLLVGGPNTTADLAVAVRVLLAALLVLGLGCALGSLWKFFTADAGAPRTLTLEQFKLEYQGSREVYDVAAAQAVAKLIGEGRRLLLGALVFLSLASVVWLLAAPPPSVSTVVTVETRNGATYCGVLASGDATGVVLKISGAAEPLRLPFNTVARIVPMAGAC